MPKSNRKLQPGSNITLSRGDQAPDFVLRRTFEEDVALADLLNAGPVLLVFYVFDFGHV